MRAGSLSDPRVLALLEACFVPVHVTELCTQSLLADPRDAGILQRLHDANRAARGAFAVGFWGGEREAFLDLDGELLDVFLSLGQQTEADSQFLVEQRQRPEARVQEFFRRAARALRASTGAVPPEFAACRDGTSKRVAAFASWSMPCPELPAGQVGLQVHVRNDRVMYTDLVGTALLRLSAAQARSLLPDLESGSTSRTWPQPLFLRLAHLTYPRGHVAPRLADSSITGEVRTLVDAAAGDEVRGRFAGHLDLDPRDPEELGFRKEARTDFRLQCGLVGEFCFDRRQGRFTALRLVSQNAELRHRWPGREHALDRYALGVELAPAPAHLRR